MRQERVVIIGAGPAGVTAALHCRRLGVTPLLLDRVGRAGGLAENARLIENYPGLPKPLCGREFVENLRSQLSHSSQAIDRVEVQRITRNGNGFSVEHSEGRLLASTVIVASGTEARRLDIKGIDQFDGGHVFYEVRPLLRRHLKPCNVVIIGGGEAACDYALSLVSVGATVHLLVRSDCLKARGKLAHEVHQAAAAQIHYETQCERITAGTPLTVHLRNSTTEGTVKLRSDALLIAVGRHSTAPLLLEPLGISQPAQVNGSIPGLFVVGDARLGALGQIGLAVGDGISAATAAVAYLERQRCCV